MSEQTEQAEFLDEFRQDVFPQGWGNLIGKPKDDEAEPVKAKPMVVTGIFVKANQNHEHDGILHYAGKSFVLPCEIASELIAKGVVTFLYKIEEPAL